MNRPPYPVTAICYSPDGALSTAELAAFAKDATQWIGDVVAPWWARCMSFRAVDPGAALDPVMPQIAFAHHEQVVGALGHHWADKGALRALVAVDDSASAGGWPDTGLHEAAEMDADPSGSDVRLIGNLIVPVEIMDMVENDPGGKNCVTPAYFDPEMVAAGIPVDDQGRLPRGIDVDGVVPMTPGGYCAFFDITKPDAGWQQKDARGNDRVAPPHSRIARKLKRLQPHVQRLAARLGAREFDTSDVTPVDRPLRNGEKP